MTPAQRANPNNQRCSDDDEPDIKEDEQSDVDTVRKLDCAIDDFDDEEEADDEEPRLKYTRLTKSLGGVYRNGDAVSACIVFGERMVR
jgi:hypothetical protein